MGGMFFFNSKSIIYAASNADTLQFFEVSDALGELVAEE
jgi:hypothetical protein